MKFTQRARGVVQAIAVVLSLALPLCWRSSSADARVGGGFSSGSRGTRTFSAPPSTSTAPGTAQPFNRTFTPAGQPRHRHAAAGGGFFNRPGGGMLGGLAAGFLGAGLLGMLFGGGMFGGLGGLSSLFGLILQIGLIVFVVRMAMSWWQRRHDTRRPMPARAAGYRRRHRASAPEPVSAWDRAARRSRSFRPITKPSNGCSAKFRRRGRTRMSPSCIRWRRRKWCRISPAISRRTRRATSSTRSPAPSCCRAILPKPGAKAIPISPAWRCGSRWSTRPLDRATGRLVEGSEQPTEATEVWTFLRPRGANWELSAIQQT